VSKSAPVALQAVTPKGLPTEKGVAAIIGLAVAGVLSVLALMTRGDYPASFQADIEAMQDTTQWVAWVLVLAIQAAIWFALLVPIILVTSKSTAGWSFTLGVLVGLVFVLIILPFVSPFMFERPHRVQEALDQRLRWLTGFGSVVGFVAAIGIVRTVKQIVSTPIPRVPSVEEVSSYVEMRRRLLFLGGVLALIVALAVLSFGGFRNAVVAMETARATRETAAAEVARDDEKPDHLKAAARATKRATRFGVELVWAYGLYYSFVLVLVYLPAYLSLLDRGRKIRDAIKPAVLPTDSAYEETKKVRAELDEILQLKVGAVEGLKAATLILVPLVTSLASTLVGGVEIAG
jgi:hypothetical protein